MTNHDTSANEFGKILKKLRKTRGLNQEELAAVLGVRKTTISNYETGYSTPTGATMRQIADYFGVSLDIILPPKPTFEDDLVGRKTASSPLLQEEGPLEASNEKIIPVFEKIYQNDKEIVPIFTLKLPQGFIGGGSFRGLIVADDRMDRAGLPASGIAILKEQPFADDGDLVAVAIGDAPALLGRLFVNGNMATVVAESSNSAHRPVSFTLGDSSAQILGKVVTVIQSV